MASLDSIVKLFDDFKQNFNKPTPDLAVLKSLVDKLKVYDHGECTQERNRN